MAITSDLTVSHTAFTKVNSPVGTDEISVSVFLKNQYDRLLWAVTVDDTAPTAGIIPIRGNVDNFITNIPVPANGQLWLKADGDNDIVVGLFK